MTITRRVMGTVAAAALMASAQAGFAGSHSEGITVGYFLEWPMPFQYAKQEGMYDEALGMPVNWVSFDTGTAMSAAMASGDVQMSVSQGVPPFVVATSAGQDLQILDVAVSYSDPTAIKLPVYGRVQLTGTQPAGTYTDVVQVTVTW